MELDDFRRWTSELELDTGDLWHLEDFQALIVADILAGFSEVWAVLPEGNAKTTLAAGIALFHLLRTRSAFVPIGAASREQAEIMYRQAEGFVLRSPQLRELLKCQEGYRRIKRKDGLGRIQVYAADDRTADGVIPTLAVLDELHRHRDLRLYRTWRGKIEKRGGQIIAISTAGEPESDFEDTRAKIVKEAERVDTDGAHIRAEAPGIVLHDWAVRERSKSRDLDEVKKANPLIDLATLRRKYESPTTSDAHWLRFVCNIATRISGQAILPEDWDRLEETDVVPRIESWSAGFLDLGWKIDTTAMGILTWETNERRVVSGVRVIEPPVDEADIVEGLVYLQREFGPVGWVYDPNAGGQQMVQLLQKGEHPRQQGVDFTFIEHSQDNAPMARAAARLDEAIRQKWLVHDGNPSLRRHVLNAIRRDLGGEKWKYDRPNEAKGERRKKFPIDALTGLLMAHSVGYAENNEGRSKTAHIF